MGARRRVSFVLGTWQLTVVCACLDQDDADTSDPVEDHLVLYGPGLPDDLKRAMTSLAGASERTWTTITWADDLLLKPQRPGGGDVGLVTALRERIGLTHCDEVWVCKLYDFAEKIALETFPGATVQLYEDGMHFYVNQPVVRGPANDWGTALRSMPRRAALLTIGKHDTWWMSGMWADHIARVDGMWALSPPTTGLPLQTLGPRHHIDPTRLRTAVHRITTVATHTEWQPHSNRRVAIVLGQAFARFGLMTTATETELYISVCAQLLNDDFEVLWKDHPRLPQGYADEILTTLASTGPISTLPLTPEWPVEAAIERIRPTALVSGTSTSLFVCAALYDTHAYTYANSLRLPALRADQRRMVTLARRAFPPPNHARSAPNPHTQPIEAA